MAQEPEPEDDAQQSTEAPGGSNHSVAESLKLLASNAGSITGHAIDRVGDAAGNVSAQVSGLFNRASEHTVADQDEEAQAYAIKFINKILRLRSVRIDREQFLAVELRKKSVPENVITAALQDRPATAGVSAAVIDAIARESIEFETRKSTALSFAAGLPGGFAMAGTIPADITQFYIHAFRVMQKLAYLYGWESFLDDCDDIDDETLGLLAAFFGVMIGVAGASNSLIVFAVRTVSPAVEKNIARQALTKGAVYPVIKRTLRIIGVHITKQSFAKSLSKIVPVVGGAISGGLTYASLKVESSRLMEHLKSLPPALPGHSETAMDPNDPFSHAPVDI
ncbi:hypothetical protein [Bifidobacterium crudilactis]|jgi:hypothetical protein|uniref:hypothetical protein n=1 Tax=Bifidobacterium crudilactis TaxID=327277 RepID=UPI002F352F50